MAAPEARPWEDLPVANLFEIFCRLPCAEDRRRAYRACPPWLNALNELRPTAVPPALPWLLLPALNADGATTTRLVCVLSGCRVHEDHLYAAMVPRGARCFGSHDGGWLFVQMEEDRRHELVNLRTGDVRGLPGEILLGPNANQNQPVDALNTIRAAALSASPQDDAATYLFIVAGGIPPPDDRYVAIWRDGWSRAVEVRPPEAPLIGFLLAEDVVYHDGAFHLLHADDDHTSVCTIKMLDLGHCRVEWENRRFHPGGHGYDYDQFLHPRPDSYEFRFVRSRYLVSSRGDLLLVVRLAPRATQTTTYKFKVFRATQRLHQVPEPDPAFPIAAYPWAWTELDTLDARVLFVGHGCSRSYELNDAQGRVQYRGGFEAGVYFVDDREHHYDVRYPCSDNGRWSESDDRVHLCFPPVGASWISPPAWILL